MSLTTNFLQFRNDLQEHIQEHYRKLEDSMANASDSLKAEAYNAAQLELANEPSIWDSAIEKQDIQFS